MVIVEIVISFIEYLIDFIARVGVSFLGLMKNLLSFFASLNLDKILSFLGALFGGGS